MFERDASILAAPTRRLRTFRRVANFAPVLLLLFFGLVTLLNRAFPFYATGGPVLGVTLLGLFGAIAVPWFATMLAFYSGRMKCPCCGASFINTSPISRPLWMPRNCYYCGFDVETGRRKGDF